MELFEALVADLERQKNEAFRDHNAMIDNETNEEFHERHITRAFELQDSIREIEAIRRRLYG